MDERQERIARNEALFREVNEAIERGRWPGEEEQPAAFRCECANLGCAELIDLSVVEYERVRAYPRRFVIKPGHEIPDAETVVDRHDGYVVVEKLGVGGEVADDTDPRKPS